MSLANAITLLHTGHLVIHKETAYAIVDERLVICRYNAEKHLIEHYYESNQTINMLFYLFQDFNQHSGKCVVNRPPVAEGLVIEDGRLYDFSKLLEVECPTCQTWCGKRTVIRQGRYARCPGCGRAYWRASLLSGERETPLPVPPKITKISEEEKEKKKKLSKEAKELQELQEEEERINEALEENKVNIRFKLVKTF